MFKIFIAFVILSINVFGQSVQFDFPLDQGNIWQYSENPGHVSESFVLTDTLMSNNKIYTIIQGDIFVGYYRQEGTKVFRFLPDIETEELQYDFSLTMGDTLSMEINEGDTLVTTVFDRGTINAFGYEREQIIFHTTSSQSSWYELNYLVDSIGLIQHNSESLYYYLAGAVIRGQKYGIIVETEESAEEIPTEYILKQNYPNPFNPSTTI